MQVASPDEVVRHRPMVCGHCQQQLEGIAGHVKERRQIHDMPQVRLVVREHQVEEVCCPACQNISVGSLPTGVQAPMQYGPISRPNGTCGWSKSNKISQALFAVRRGRRLFDASAVISPPCVSKVMPNPARGCIRKLGSEDGIACLPKNADIHAQFGANRNVYMLEGNFYGYPTMLNCKSSYRVGVI